MLKLYRLSPTEKEYWETWQEPSGGHTIHWGKLGTRGSSKTVTSSLLRSADKTLQSELGAAVSQGFAPIPPENHSILMIEYVVEGFGSEADLDKRHRLENRMNETLGWTGLGACDGGSIGSGTMEVCNFVVDFELAKQVIEADLANSEFSDYARIYESS